MSPCRWRNDPGTTTGGHRLSSHPLRRWPRQRSLGELTGGQRWGALQLGGLGRAPPAPRALHMQTAGTSPGLHHGREVRVIARHWSPR